MVDLTENKYEPILYWIKNARKREFSWEKISNGLKSDKSSLNNFLENKIIEDGWPNIDEEKFVEIVKECKRIEENETGGFISYPATSNNFTVPLLEESSWQCYKKTLIDNHFDIDTIESIEKSTIMILNHLSNNTTHLYNEEVIKGLVIGNVQSGKTSNMEALISMAADYGWNMFIILSGTIENLRVQTQNRIKDDLFKHQGAMNWAEIDRPELGKGPKLQELYLGKNKNMRYFTVCLKNITRLNNLLKWLQSDENQASNMRILIIDDEADQAGINTADIEEDEKTKIYESITNIVNQKDKNGENANHKFGAMNYIGYTATPYANLLNDPRCESLYPKNFICTLPVSKQYFGPQQIFGNDDLNYPGLDILRNISDSDHTNIKEIHKYTSLKLPYSLIESIIWFICGTACLRYLGFKKPVSMLIHTSQKTNFHENIAEAIKNWFDTISYEEIMILCASVWFKETERLSYEKFIEQYYDYKISDSTMKSYPDFKDICPYIFEMLNISENKYTYIKLSEKSKNSKKHFSKSIHLCIDNCKNNKSKSGSDGTYTNLRLTYPTKEDNLDFAPAFLVIGGATLSRGLTLEGLISSYFIRSIEQADSLMQMGRWFGYRKGYELLPRIWIMTDSERYFQYLSKMDQELRDNIKEMQDAGKTPYEYRIKILMPQKDNNLKLSNQNKLQSVKEKRDYAGTSKQTYLFDNDESKFIKNIQVLKDLLDKLGNPCTEGLNIIAEHSVVWRGINIEEILKFLENYEFQKNDTEFNNLSIWLKSRKEILSSWNIVLCGNKTPSPKLGTFSYNGYQINKVNRSKFSKNNNPDDTLINIGTLRNPLDLLSDIDVSGNPNLSEEIKNAMASSVKKIRRKSKQKETPQLLLYVISSKSEAEKNNRVDLNTINDIVGFNIYIPEQHTDTADKEEKEYCEIDFDKLAN